MPRSECTTSRAAGRGRATAISTASTTNRLSIAEDIDQPTTFREWRSSAAARDSQPSAVGRDVTSATRLRFADSGSNFRSSRFAATGRRRFESVVRTRDRFRLRERMPCRLMSFATVLRLQTRPRAAGSACTRGEP